MKVAGSVFLITGASSGIGAELARQLLARGAKVALVARNEANLRQVAAKYPEALVLPADLLDAANRGAVVAQTIAHFGRLDVLVNNAGLGQYAPSWSARPADTRHILELNFIAAVELTQHAVPQMMKQHGGMIVNVASIAGQVTLPWFTLYSATKAALGALTRGLRSELKRDGIHCVEVCPGYVRTAFQRNVLSGSPPEALVAGRRFATSAENCANAIVRAVERESRTVITPVSGRLLLAAQALFPALVEAQLARMMHRQEARP